MRRFQTGWRSTNPLELEFPTTAPAQLVLERPDLKRLLADLTQLLDNTTDQVAEATSGCRRAGL